MNVGIGVVLGLLAALLAVFLVTRGGPFKEQSATRTIEPSSTNSDPNAPLYGPNVAPLPPSATNDNTQGAGVAALTDNGTTVPKANVSATSKTAKPVEPSDKDPVAAMIDAANKGKPEVGKSDAGKPDAPKPSTPKPIEPVAAPKEVKPTPAPAGVAKKDTQNSDK
ncbi:MAG: hypothetical protein ACRCV6_05325 [Formosimonas sp.]